jgi:hypothetical protein
LNRLNHAALTFEEPGDIFSAIGQAVGRIPHLRPGV